MEVNLEADCDAAIDSCRWPTRAMEGADDEATRRRDDETTMVESIVVAVYYDIDCLAGLERIIMPLLAPHGDGLFRPLPEQKFFER